jgi:hypothetical protein
VWKHVKLETVTTELAVAVAVASLDFESVAVRFVLGKLGPEIVQTVLRSVAVRLAWACLSVVEKNLRPGMLKKPREVCARFECLGEAIRQAMLASIDCIAAAVAVVAVENRRDYKQLDCRLDYRLLGYIGVLDRSFVENKLH